MANLVALELEVQAFNEEINNFLSTRKETEITIISEHLDESIKNMLDIKVNLVKDLKSLKGYLLITSLDFETLIDFFFESGISNLDLKIKNYETGDTMDIVKYIRRKTSEEIRPIFNLVGESNNLETKNPPDFLSKLALTTETGEVDETELVFKLPNLFDKKYLKPDEEFKTIILDSEEKVDIVRKRLLNGNCNLIQKLITPLKTFKGLFIDNKDYNGIVFNCECRTIENILELLVELIKRENLSCIFVHTLDDKNFLFELGIPKAFVRVLE